MSTFSLRHTEPFLGPGIFLLVLAGSLVVAGYGVPGGSFAGDGSDPVDGYETQPSPIVVDGDGSDWSELSVRYDDAGDGSQPLALERLWMAHDEDHLFLRLTTDRPINLQETNDLTLYLDTDNDTSTGVSVLGLGAELRWTFGAREGMVRDGSVDHEDLGLAALPTVRSDSFEIVLDRSARPAGQRLFSGDSLRVAFSAGGDRLPDADGGLGYVLSKTEAIPRSPSLDRPKEADVRLLSYNIPNDFDGEENTLFEPDRHPSHERILEAVGADVIGFQEMYDDSAAAVEEVVENELGVVPASWRWAKTGGELVLGTRFPIRDTTSIPGFSSEEETEESGAFLLDTEAVLGRRLLVVLMHPPCCNEPGDNRQRQATVDGVVAFLRDVKRGNASIDVAPQTPIVVMGDMNFVGDPQQPRSLRTGTIVNTDRFGEGVPPDWDGSQLLDTNPRQTGAPLHATTFNPESEFAPGRLDYAYVTDHVLDVVHEFVLSTPALSEATRNAYDLNADDTTVGSDHLPVVIDVTHK